MRDRARIAQTVTTLAPEVVVHLAGRCATADGLKRPLDSFDTNVTGTLNLLHAACRTPSLRAIVVVTSANVPPRGSDACTMTGSGTDPVSASLVCAEIIAETFRRCYLQSADGIGLATLQLPEIVGGGDFNRERLVPSLVRAAFAGRQAALVASTAALPLLYVLDALRCCLQLAEALLHRPDAHARTWSPAAAPPGPWSAALVATHVAALLEGRPAPWTKPVAHAATAAPYLEGLMVIERSAVRPGAERRSWADAASLDVPMALDWTVEGYRRLEADGHAGFIGEQIARFESLSTTTTRQQALLLDPPTPSAKASHASLSA
jgi:CDP-glucose 4,6-dehydratase